MSDPASRRRRPSAPPPPKRSSGGGTGGGPLPTVALAIGVIVAGLGIGALVSAFQNRGTVPELGATSIPAVTPVPQVTGPRMLPTLAPTASPVPSPSPSASPSPSPSPSPSRSPSATPSPTPTHSPAAPPSAAAGASPAASAAPAPSPSMRPTATASPRATAPPPRPTSPPIPSYASTPAAVRPASAPPARPVASTADNALALVKRYIDSLIAGDENGAYAALGGSSSDRTLDLKEEAFLDKDARITSLRASRSDATSATVDVEISAVRGSYVATFHIANGIITQHDYIKI